MSGTPEGSPVGRTARHPAEILHDALAKLNGDVKQNYSAG
jgi:hypothetical protein